MEEQLRTYLLTLVERLASVGGPSAATIGKRAVNVTAVFTRLRERSGSFNVCMADRLAHWMEDNWPCSALWPDDLPRPSEVVSFKSVVSHAA